MHPVFKQLDPEAIKRVQRGIKPHSEATPVKHQKPHRKSRSYRAARRNDVLRGEIRSTWRGVEAITPRGRWSRGKTYKPNGERECKRRRHQLEQRGLAP